VKENVTYSFRAYNYFENPDTNYNLVYFYKDGKWNYSLLKVENDHTSKPHFDSRFGTVKATQNIQNRGACIEPYTTINYHCTGTGACADGICDGCDLCVTTSSDTMVFDCNGSSGGSGGGSGDTGGGSNPGGSTGGFSDPSPYYFDPNEEPDLDPNKLRARRAYYFWQDQVVPMGYEAQQWAVGNSYTYIQILENYLNNYAVPNNNQNLQFHNWAIKFFIQNPNTTWAQFQNWFIEGYSDNFKTRISQLSNVELQEFVSINQEITTSPYVEEYIKETNEAFVAFASHADIENITDAQMQTVLNQCCPSIIIVPQALIQEKTQMIIANYLFYRKFYPEWNKSKCFWEASRESIQLLLDLGGLVPVVGEVCDITNGVIYTIQGDGVNASLSYVGAVPFAGWFATGSKLGIKAVNASDIASRQVLKWIVGTDGLVKFGYSNQLRKVLKLTDVTKQAHHIIPWSLHNNSIVQKAAKSSNAFHLNEALNGIAVASWRNQPNHNAYNNRILSKLNALPSNLTADQAYNNLLLILNQAKQAVINNPNTHLNDLIF
jgi:hypothetical protein